MKKQPKADSHARVLLAPRRGTGKTALLAAILLLCALGSSAQELDSQVHIVPALRMQAKAAPPETQAGGQNANPQGVNAQGVNALDPDSQNLDAQNSDAQNQAQTPAPAAQSQIVIPPGTRVSLVLSQAVSLSHARPGDTINLQTSFPVAVENQMAIPPGTYVKGVIEKVTHKDKNRAVMAMRLRSADIVFGNGYTVTIPAPVNIDPVLAQFTVPDSPHGQPAPVLAGNGGVTPPVAMGATGTTTLPPLPPLPGSGVRTAIIATGIAGAAAIVVTSILLVRNHNGYDIRMEAGTPMEIILSAPLVLDTGRVAEAIHAYGVQAGER